MLHTPQLMNETKRMECINCGFRVNLGFLDELDTCPNCGEFDSITESDKLPEEFDEALEEQR